MQCGPSSGSLAAFEVHHIHPAVSKWLDGRGTLRWQTFWEIQHVQWHKARLCPSSSVIQPILYPNATVCFQRSRPWCIHKISSRWLSVWPLMLYSKTKTLERLITKVLFADDCALVAYHENHMQTIIHTFTVAFKVFGLMIMLWKTEVLLKPAPNSVLQQPCITINSTCLKNNNSFNYLCSSIASKWSLNIEITANIQKASQALMRLPSKFLQQRDMCLSMKLRVYNAVVLPSLLYSCKTLALYCKHVKQLEKFHTWSLWWMLCMAVLYVILKVV